ncbi:hypothetical protein HMI55_002957 [Coelomomyces lativittatus]|nr:hypothetical protein HMI55_002957 [Coelomomyces lativittatus]KAJ1512683.1 hypothetical protein HMI56_003706 [Coelomomyces lativittatus]
MDTKSKMAAFIYPSMILSPFFVFLLMYLIHRLRDYLRRSNSGFQLEKKDSSFSVEKEDIQKNSPTTEKIQL